MAQKGRLIRIGTRGSALALAQCREVVRHLRKHFPARRFQVIIVKTEGDEFQGVEIFKQKNVGVFTKTIEEKLLNGRIDVAIHSLKDLPTDLPPGLMIGAYPKREDPSDALVSRSGMSLDELAKGAKVGTGSPRRMRQLAILRPDLRAVPIRGNLDTRIGRVLKKKTLDAVVVARAGLARLKKFSRFAKTIPADRFLPAVGQGALALEVRESDREMRTLVSRLNHSETEKKVRAERAFLRTLGGGCRVPVGVHSQMMKGKIRLRARVFSVKSARSVKGEILAPAREFEKAGEKLAQELLQRGARKFLQEARQNP